VNKSIRLLALVFLASQVIFAWDIERSDTQQPTNDRAAFYAAVITGNLLSIATILTTTSTLIDARDALSGNTAMHFAVYDRPGKDVAATVQVLLDKGFANLNATNHLAQTALWCAIHNDQTEAAKLLIEKGANIMITNPLTGWTVLHLAAYKQNSQLVDFLLVKGALPYTMSRVGETVLDIAHEGGNGNALVANNQQIVTTSVAQLIIQKVSWWSLCKTYGVGFTLKMLFQYRLVPKLHRFMPKLYQLEALLITFLRKRKSF
jgi:ankyrin repeat protein